jgi:hypothetical protein
MDGLALARAVKEKYPGLPVLLATGYSEAAQGVEAEFPILRKSRTRAEQGGRHADEREIGTARREARAVQPGPARRCVKLRHPRGMISYVSRRARNVAASRGLRRASPVRGPDGCQAGI